MPDNTSTESQPKQDISLILPQRFDGRMSELAATLHSNPATGFGMPKRDSAVYQAIGIPSVLNELEIRMLYRHDWWAKLVISLAPKDMVRAGINLHITDGDEDDVGAVQAKLRRLKRSSRFRLAMQWARMFGKAYIVIRTEGESLEKPLNLRNAKPIESLWVYDRYQLKPATGQWNIIDPEEYQLVTYPGGSHLLGRDGEPMRLGQKIHKSRVLVFWGEELPPADRRDNEGCDDSVLQTMYSVLLRYRNASGAINKAIESFSILRVAIEGLAGLISKEGGVEKAKTLMQEISMQMSLFGTLLTDKTTAEAGFESRGLGGVEPVFSKIIKDELTACSRYPYYKLWGQVAKTSLAESGSSETKAYADLVLGWQEEDFRDPDEQLFTYTMASELGYVPDDWSFEYESLYSQSPEEQAKIFDIYAGAYAKLATAGIVTSEEVRKTLASGEIENLGNAIDSDSIEVEEDDPDLDEEDDDMPTEEGEEDPEIDREDGLGLRDYRADAKVSGLKRNGKGQVWYRNRWWTLNKPVPSDRKGKKKMVLASKGGEVKLIHFGDSSMSDYTQHKSEKRRKNFKSRFAGIKNKAGEHVIKDKHSAAYWANRVLW